MKFLVQIVYAYLQVKWRRRFRSRSQLERWQDRMVLRQLKRTLPKSAYYRRRFANRDISSWRDLPVMDKAEMMAHFSELNTLGIQKEDAFACVQSSGRERLPIINHVVVGLSSGTSGHFGIFLASRDEQATWVGVALAKILPRSIFAKQRIALFLRANSQLYESLGKTRCQFRFFDLGIDLLSHIEELQRFDPSILVAPPSVLRFLARTKKPETLNPIKIISCAEVLEDDDARVIAAAFGLRVDQIYQATEGFLGATCEQGTIHLNEDFLVIEKEPIDEQRFVPIITDFTKTSQPLIRYRLNDILVERKEPCPCGSVLLGISHIEGRCDDVLYFLAKEGSSLIRIFPDFLRTMMNQIKDVEIMNYRIVQRDHTKIDVYIDSMTFPSDRLESSLQRELQKLCSVRKAQVPTVRFYAWEKLPLTTKLRRIEQGMS